MARSKAGMKLEILKELCDEHDDFEEMLREQNKSENTKKRLEKSLGEVEAEMIKGIKEWNKLTPKKDSKP